jgi:methylated-DNA-[protein]-cysteine S-methyltransferase
LLIELSHLESPLGNVALALCEDALCALDFAETDASLRSRLERCYPGAQFENGKRGTWLTERVRAYFAGDLRALDGIRVATIGTPFQKRVWSALRRIPVGETTSYRAIAMAIGNPAAVRAVGMANGRNPVALVVPCHRVIASDGTLCGYGGGLWRKEWLLRHEKATWRGSQQHGANEPLAVRRTLSY